MKRLLGIVTAGLLAATFVASGPTSATASPRVGALQVTKECSHYDGTAGSFCTITASNIPAIKAGWTVVYTHAMGSDGTLDTDVVIGNGNGNGNKLFGHVTLNATTMLITFVGGTSEFGDFNGNAIVSVTSDGLWHWNGNYSFGSG
jgi:hypothetical protein